MKRDLIFFMFLLMFSGGAFAQPNPLPIVYLQVDDHSIVKYEYNGINYFVILSNDSIIFNESYLSYLNYSSHKLSNPIKKTISIPFRIWRNYDKIITLHFLNMRKEDIYVYVYIPIRESLGFVLGENDTISFGKMNLEKGTYIIDNDFFTPRKGIIIPLPDNSFIENTLGKGMIRNDYSEWINSNNNFYLNQTYSGAISGKDVSENVLPTKAIMGTRVDDDYSNLISFPSESNPTFEPTFISDRIISADRGSGGTYLSNEIHYRVSNLRKGTNKRTGHIHVGFFKG